MATLFRIIKNAWFTPPKDVKESYTGRNVIITGATSGIGLEAAVKFVNLGASKVIIAARDLSKGEAVKADIEARTGKRGVLEVWELDLDSYDSVIAFSERAKALDHLDIAVLNAGLRKSSFVQSKYGWELDLQVQVLSTTLLAILLLPKLKEAKGQTGKIPVLEFTNSGLHNVAKLDPGAVASDSLLQAYNSADRFAPQNQYGVTKLLLMYATNTIASQVSSGDVIVTSICPGIVKSDLGREVQFPGVKIALAVFGFLAMRSPEQGARSIVSGTTQGERLHGRFWQHDQIQPVGRNIAGEENRKLAARVWNEIIEALSKDVPNMKDALRSALGAGH
jgi:NAD(P)-dependent dehydrogenase (short-subunit alcohol dehydrogenase family)